MYDYPEADEFEHEQNNRLDDPYIDGNADPTSDEVTEFQEETEDPVEEQIKILHEKEGIPMPDEEVEG